MTQKGCEPTTNSDKMLALGHSVMQLKVYLNRVKTVGLEDGKII